MVFHGSHIRKHQRYAYLQFITFFSLGPQVSEGSHRAICVDLSDSGMCMYTPNRLRKGQVILFNNLLPVQRPKAIVRWVEEYRTNGRFYKSGIMFSGRMKENSVGSSHYEHGHREDSPPAGIEKRSTPIESANFAFPGANYRVATGNDFWFDLAELSENEAGRFIALTSEVMLREPMKDDVSLRFLRAIAFFRKARIIFSRQDKHWDDKTLDLVEKSLIDFRAVDELAGNNDELYHLSGLEENRDAAARALEGERPGRAQEILGKTKLAYIGGRLYLRNRQHAPSDEEMAIFENIFFHYPVIVRSAEIFYKVLGEPGKRYINVLLYKETSPLNSAGEAIEPLCVIRLVEDGTFHLVKDLAAGDASGGLWKEEEEAARPLNEEQSGEEARHMKTAWGGNDQKVYECSDGEKSSAVAPEGVTSGVGEGGNKKKISLLIAFAVLLLLMAAAYLLKSYPIKQVSEPDKQVPPRSRPTLTNESAGLSPLLSEPPESRSSLTREPKSSTKIIGHKSRREQTDKEKKRSRKPEANAEGRTITNPGRTRGTPKIKKRSFSPPSREDL